jgi:hypothetical protein
MNIEDYIQEITDDRYQPYILEPGDCNVIVPKSHYKELVEFHNTYKDTISDFKYSAVINVPPIRYHHSATITYFIKSNDNEEFKKYMEDFIKELKEKIVEEGRILNENRNNGVYIKELKTIKSKWWYKLFTKINL